MSIKRKSRRGCCFFYFSKVCCVICLPVWLLARAHSHGRQGRPVTARRASSASASYCYHTADCCGFFCPVFFFRAEPVRKIPTNLSQMKRPHASDVTRVSLLNGWFCGGMTCCRSESVGTTESRVMNWWAAAMTAPPSMRQTWIVSPRWLIKYRRGKSSPTDRWRVNRRVTSPTLRSRCV